MNISFLSKVSYTYTAISYFYCSANFILNHNQTRKDRHFKLHFIQLPKRKIIFRYVCSYYYRWLNRFQIAISTLQKIVKNYILFVFFFLSLLLMLVRYEYITKQLYISITPNSQWSLPPMDNFNKRCVS